MLHPELRRALDVTLTFVKTVYKPILWTTKEGHMKHRGKRCIHLRRKSLHTSVLEQFCRLPVYLCDELLLCASVS